MREVVPIPWYSMPGIEGRYKVARMAGEGEQTAGVAGVPLGVVHYFPLSLSAYAAGAERRGQGECTAERVVAIHHWPGLGVRTAGRPWELDMEAGVRGECEVGAEGKQQGDCGEERRHG